jgi:hypothetical protein
MLGAMDGTGILELAPADITQPATLLPEFFQGVRQLVHCAAVTVGPKEGDTQDRSKYMQGVKFYDPTIVGATPEMVGAPSRQRAKCFSKIVTLLPGLFLTSPRPTMTRTLPYTLRRWSIKACETWCVWRRRRWVWKVEKFCSAWRTER